MLVVGAGLIGLAAADALASRGAAVTLVAARMPGEASAAAAGMLAPTVEPLVGAAYSFALQARERYPGYVRDLEDRTGVQVPLDRRGILEVAHGNERAGRLRSRAVGDARWCSAGELAELEPSLAPAEGALFHPLDGAVDNVALLHALERAVASRGTVHRVDAKAFGIRGPRPGLAVQLDSGAVLEDDVIVLATGAWSAGIEGLPRQLPIEPARGQMIALGAGHLRHVIYSEDAYLVPRPDGRVLVGATMERVGFDDSTTPQALGRLRDAAARIAPVLRRAPLLSAWAGLRPMTPDGLPIIGPDPDWPGLLYASGHSRNGILLAPLTADCIAALAVGEEPSHDLSPFSISRFRDPARR